MLSALIPVGDEGYTYDGGRAMATVGNPIAFGDIMIFGAIVAAALAWRVPGRSRLLWAVAAALRLCTLALGQVSIVLGLAVAALSFAIVTRTVGRVVIGACALLAVAAVVLQPILDARLSDSDPSTGLPSSWTGRYGRLENLQQYFLPDIGTDFNWVFGVRTAGRAEGQEFWRPWVYIESGYVWALWTGGLLLLVAVAALLVSAVRAGRRLVASTDPTTSAVGIALVTLACTLAFLMIFDPHLTFRGGASCSSSCSPWEPHWTRAPGAPTVPTTWRYPMPWPEAVRRRLRLRSGSDAADRICLVRQRDYYELSLRREAEALRDAGFDVDIVCLREPAARPSRSTAE